MERQARSDNGRMDQAATVPTANDRAPSAFLTDDREWIDRIRGGSPRALESLFRTHVRSLTAFAFRYVQSYDSAARVVDEVFARLWRGRHSWAFHGSVRGNLYASTHRVSLEALKRTRTEARWHAGLPVTDPAPADGEQPAGVVTIGPSDLHAVMHDTIARLPAVTRTVAFMRWADRLTREEIATVMGSNVRTVHTQITPASRAMRKRLAPTNWVLDRRSALSTLRDAGEGVDPFPMIDPDRIEYYLAGESNSGVVADLCREVTSAGGDPTALEAMESAWYGPGRIIADVVDPDSAWNALAGKLSFGQPHRGRGGWRPSLPDATAAMAMVRAVADAGRRRAGAITTQAMTFKMWATAQRERFRPPSTSAASSPSAGASTYDAGVPSRRTADLVHESWLDQPLAEPVGLRVRGAMSGGLETASNALRRWANLTLQAVQAAASYVDARVMRAIGIVVLGLALTASVWALLSRHALAADAAASAPPPAVRLRASPNAASPKATAPEHRAAPNEARRRRRGTTRDSSGR